MLPNYILAGQVYRNTFRSAMEQWETKTCIQFVERTNEHDYVEMTEDLRCKHTLLFVLPGGVIVFISSHFHAGMDLSHTVSPPSFSCSSYIGRKGGKQPVTIGPNCGEVGNAIHELGHVIGFAHEHSRPDRDDYITVLWDNVDQYFRANFCKLKASDVNSLGVGYDYDSVMHYSGTAFSVNGQPTIEPHDPNVTIGQRRNISNKDALQVNKMYGCMAVEDADTLSTNDTEAVNSTCECLRSVHRCLSAIKCGFVWHCLMCLSCCEEAGAFHT